MKALSIVALVFAGLSIFIPVGGVWIAMICSIMALIAFRTETTLAGITIGIDIINTAFLSPSIVVADAISSTDAKYLFDENGTAPTDTGDVYMVYVGFHLVLFAIAIAWRVIKGEVKKDSV